MDSSRLGANGNQETPELRDPNRESWSSDRQTSSQTERVSLSVSDKWHQRQLNPLMLLASHRAQGRGDTETQSRGEPLKTKSHERLSAASNVAAPSPVSRQKLVWIEFYREDCPCRLECDATFFGQAVEEWL